MSFSKKKIIALVVIGVLIVICIVLGITYAFMRPINDTSSITSVSLNSCAHITLTDTGDSINLSNSYPMTKNRALQTTPYTFTLSSTCNTSVGFNIYIATLNTNTIDASSIHYIITEHNNKTNILSEGILSEATNALSDFEDYELSELNNGINGTYGNIYSIYNNGLHDTELVYDLYLYIDESVTNETMGGTFRAGVAVKTFDYNFATINSVTTSNITTDSITLTVNATNGDNSITTYYYSKDNGSSYESSSSNTYTFDGLERGTEYNFRVYAVDTEGYPSNEYTLSATTDNYVNPVVNSVTATSVSNDSITVSVSASAGTNNIQTYYYSINNSSYASSSLNTHTFSGLNAGQTYDIRVYVVDTNGIQSNVYNLSVQTDTVLLADYIKSKYTSQGANGLYYHTSSLANSAADNSYRYAGANPNNYVCFGSDAASCPSANLYRIIGVFGNEVKLIKSTSYGDYEWDSGGSNTWSSSDIRNTLNNTFLDNIGDAWNDKIATHAYKVGGMSYNTSYTAKQYYNTEVGSSSSSTPGSMKIGLMYVSDFGFAASPDYWTTELFNYKSAKSSNWLAGLTEWTISRRSDITRYAFRVISTGFVDGIYGVDFTNAVRPVFYLSSSISYVSGSGSSADPIRLS